MSSDTDFKFDDLNDAPTNNDEVDLSGMGDDEDFNIYGGLSGSDILDGMPNGFYDMEIVKISKAYKEEDDRHSIVFTWEVYDNDSDFVGQQAQQYFTVYPNLARDINEGRLNNREKADIYKKMSWLKKHLARIGMTPMEIDAGKWSVLQNRVGIRRRLEIAVKDDFANVKSIAEIPGHADKVEDDGFKIDNIEF